MGSNDVLMRRGVESGDFNKMRLNHNGHCEHFAYFRHCEEARRADAAIAILYNFLPLQGEVFA